MKAIFVTTNEHKRREVQRILGVELEGAALGDRDVPEVQSLNFEEVAKAKALAAREALGRPGHPVLVEDSGVVIRAWNGLPGPLTKLFLSAVGNEGLLRMLAGEEDRSALAVCAVAVADSGGEIRVFRGEVAGTVAPGPRGAGGFGYDAIFVPDGGALTYAELGDEKSAIQASTEPEDAGMTTVYVTRQYRLARPPEPIDAVLPVPKSTAEHRVEGHP